MKTIKGQSFYDQTGVFEQYVKHRAKPDNPNEVIETPIVQALIGEVKGKSCLDIGCGYGAMAEYLQEQQVASYLGIDPSGKMIAAARERVVQRNFRFELGQVEELAIEVEQYDIVISRLVFHYVADITSVFQSIFAGLRSDGIFIFSVEHAVMTALMDKAKAGSKKEGWKVGAYFEEGPRAHQWMGAAVTKYHKTIETYFAALRQSGFLVQDLREGRPDKQHFTSENEYTRRLELPRYLIFKAVKLKGSH
ncbi:MAG: methyltransferase domain-containing protein [Saprospiraceae bacterium]|nr:methyltransferase domain-containing protein [Saprospiraceae bacterium]